MKKYKYVEGYDKQYRVDVDGFVWSCKNRLQQWVQLKSCVVYRKGGKPICCVVNLSHMGKVQRYLVHILVLQVFVGPCPEGMECRHLDGDPTNNAVFNLKWDTHFENCKDRIRHGTEVHGTRNGNAVFTECQVMRMRDLRSKGWSLEDIAEYFDSPVSTITWITNGRGWKHLPGAIKVTGGRGCAGVAKSDDHRRKISETLKERNRQKREASAKIG